MNIDFNIKDLSPTAQRLVLYRANQWDCSPAAAFLRIVEERASRELPKIDKAIAARAAGKGETATATA